MRLMRRLINRLKKTSKRVKVILVMFVLVLVMLLFTRTFGKYFLPLSYLVNGTWRSEQPNYGYEFLQVTDSAFISMLYGIRLTYKKNINNSIIFYDIGSNQERLKMTYINPNVFLVEGKDLINHFHSMIYYRSPPYSRLTRPKYHNIPIAKIYGKWKEAKKDTPDFFTNIQIQKDIIEIDDRSIQYSWRRIQGPFHIFEGDDYYYQGHIAILDDGRLRVHFRETKGIFERID